MGQIPLSDPLGLCRIREAWLDQSHILISVRIHIILHNFPHKYKNQHLV